MTTNKTVEQSLEKYNSISQPSSKTVKAIAACGVAAGSLVCASDVEADIVYSGSLNQVINVGGSGTFDFDGDLADDIVLQVSSSFDGDGLNGAGIFANPGTNSYARNFAAGELIPGVATANGNGWMGWYNSTTSAIYSDPWGALAAGVNGTGPVTGFLGFNFNGQFGWMQLSLAADSNGVPISMTVIDWAYQDDGSGILAGDTGAIPEPSSAAALGLLALGAVGIRRRRKNAG